MVRLLKTPFYRPSVRTDAGEVMQNTEHVLKRCFIQKLIRGERRSRWPVIMVQEYPSLNLTCQRDIIPAH